MTISIEVYCACGKKERFEIDDDEAVPEQCRMCTQGNVTKAPVQQQAEIPDMWDLTVVSKKQRPLH